MVERFFDITLSGIALLILSPVLLLVMIILRFTGEREIFFLQPRIGRNGKIFNLLKFATMLKESPSIGTGTITIKNDPRVLPVGKFLRKTKVNELPQLINIFFGDMSFVGPRPLTNAQFSFYSIETKTKLLNLRPGLSGIGSIVFRNEEEIMHGSSATTDFYAQNIAPYKGSLEEWYVENKSIWLYFLVIFVTLLVVIIPTTTRVWSIFNNVPIPPDILKDPLKYK